MIKLSKFSIFFILVGLAIQAFMLIKNPELFNFQSSEKSRELYQTASKYRKNGEYKEAYYTFGKIYSGYAAYEAVLFYRAKCAAELEDEKTAIAKFKKLLSKFSDSPVAPRASYNLGQAYIRFKDFDAAEKQFIKTIRIYPETEFATGSFYYLGQINKNINDVKAAKYMLKYLKQSPSGRFFRDCIEELKTLSYKLSDDDKKIIAVSLFESGEYTESLSYLKEIPSEKSMFYIAENYNALEDKKKAISYYKKCLKNSSSFPENKAALKRAMYAYVSTLSKDKTKSWKDVLSFTKEARDYALFNIATSMPKKEGIKYYRQIVEKYPDGNYASESLWNLFWYFYQTRNDNYKFALRLAEKHMKNYSSTKAAPAVHFWTGKIYEKRLAKDKALEYYNSVLSKYPDSYYAFRADGRIKALKTGYDPGWGTNKNNIIRDNASNPDRFYSESEIIKIHGESVNELILAGDYETALIFMKDDAFLESRLILQNGIISKSVVLARNAMNKLEKKPGIGDAKWKLIYPVHFTEKINENAKINNLDPAIVLSLLKEESYFNPFAVSSSGARGLMQLLPGTAKDIAAWRNLGRYSNLDLFDPGINIKLGTAYLSYAKNNLGNNMLFATAAYNGGPSAVKNWIEKYLKEDPDEFVENIPYEQTRNYVKKVYGSYWNYKRIYHLN